jgi:hypothetical protein
MRYLLAVALAVLGIAQAAPAILPPSGLPRFAAERAHQGHNHHEDSGT